MRTEALSSQLNRYKHCKDESHKWRETFTMYLLLVISSLLAWSFPDHLCLICARIWTLLETPHTKSHLCSVKKPSGSIGTESHPGRPSSWLTPHRISWWTVSFIVFVQFRLNLSSECARSIELKSNFNYIYLKSGCWTSPIQHIWVVVY